MRHGYKLSFECGTLLQRETMTMLRSMNAIHRRSASFWCMIHVPVWIIIPVLKKKHFFLFTHVECMLFQRIMFKFEIIWMRISHVFWLRGVMVKVMDYGIVESEFELQSRYYIHFRTNTLGKGMNLLILPSMG